MIDERVECLDEMDGWCGGTELGVDGRAAKERATLCSAVLGSVAGADCVLM